LGLFFVKIICIFSSSVREEREDGFLVNVTEEVLDRAGFFGGTAIGFGNKGGGGGVEFPDEVAGGDGVSDLGSNLFTPLVSPSGELLGDALDEFGLVLFSLLYPLS
jgi:hypothetical protein